MMDGFLAATDGGTPAEEGLVATGITIPHTAIFYVGILRHWPCAHPSPGVSPRACHPSTTEWNTDSE